MIEALDHGRKLPICLRKYAKGEVECDGRPRARSEHDRMPCVYRDRCVALQRVMKVQRTPARELLKLRKVVDVDNQRRVYAFATGDGQEFQTMLNRAIDRYGIRNGRVTIRHPQEEPPRKKRTIKNRSDESKAKSTKALKKARKEASRVLKQKAADDLEATTELVKWFLSRLQRKTRRKVSEDREAAVLGELFVVDRIESSRYVTVYCKSQKRDKKRKKMVESRKPVVSVVLAARTHSLNFRFPVDVDDFNEAIAEGDRDRVGLEEFDEGRFKAKSNPLDREGISIVADSIAVAIRKGIMKLPKVAKA